MEEKPFLSEVTSFDKTAITVLAATVLEFEENAEKKVFGQVSTMGPTKGQGGQEEVEVVGTEHQILHNRS